MLGDWLDGIGKNERQLILCGSQRLSVPEMILFSKYTSLLQATFWQTN
jgi:hypothetical protein